MTDPRPATSRPEIPFLWGVATSAYQVEGAVENDWTAWELLGKLKAPGASCGRGSGHRERWRSDLDRVASLGANAYRFSVEWSRIEPREGVFDDSALEHDRGLAYHLRSLGIEPVVTLNHYTHPLWFWDNGGWEEPSSIARFRRFTEKVAASLDGLVRVWVTLNEPVVFLLGGYVAGVIPPGKRSFPQAARAFENLLRAHTEAAAVLKSRDPSCRVGMAHNMLAFAPDRPANAFDRRLVDAGERLYNGALVEAEATGRVLWAIPGLGKTVFTIPDLPASLDYFGVNYYSRVHLRFTGASGAEGAFFYRDPESRGLTDMGWEVHPQGFERVLRRAAESGLPVIVLENGIATRDDRKRSDFLREHAVVLAHAIETGVPIQGYFYWTLLDNFEWLEGFRPRFGLFEVDYASFARRRRPSADVFAALGRSFRERATRPGEASRAAGETSSAVSPK